MDFNLMDFNLMDFNLMDFNLMDFNLIDFYKNNPMDYFYNIFIIYLPIQGSNL